MKKYRQLEPYIEEGYKIFSAYSINKHLSVCDCGNCITPTEIEDLICTPLHKLSATQIGNYVGAMLASSDKAIIEVHYFLPRMLELLTQGKIFYIDEGFSLSKCHFERTDIWKPTELAFVKQFALAFFKAVLDEENFELVTAEDWLVCFGLSGLSLQPLLEYWISSAHKISAIRHFEEIFIYSLQPIGIIYKHSYFKDEHKELNNEITEWLNNRKTLEAFGKGIENLLLSDEPLNQGLIYQLENMYNIIEFELKKTTK